MSPLVDALSLSCSFILFTFFTFIFPSSSFLSYSVPHNALFLLSFTFPLTPTYSTPFTSPTPSSLFPFLHSLIPFTYLQLATERTLDQGVMGSVQLKARLHVGMRKGKFRGVCLPSPPATTTPSPRPLSLPVKACLGEGVRGGGGGSGYVDVRGFEASVVFVNDAN